MMTRVIGVFCVLAAALLGACTPKLPPAQPSPVVIAVAVLDRSTSMSASRCGEVVGLVDDLHAQFPTARVDLTYFGTGEARTAGEPVLLGNALLHCAPQGYYGGGESVNSCWQRLRTELYEACSSQITPADDSPIVLAVRRGAEAVRARKRALVSRTDLEVVHAALYGMSDLRETVDAVMTRRISRALKGKSRLPEILPLNVADVDAVVVCGISDHVTVKRAQAPRDPDGHARAWAPFFPESTVLSPTCPRAAMGEGHASPAHTEVQP